MTGRVTNEQGAALPGASVVLQGMGIGAQTNDNGQYSFVVTANRATGQSGHANGARDRLRCALRAGDADGRHDDHAELHARVAIRFTSVRS